MPKSRKSRTMKRRSGSSLKKTLKNTLVGRKLVGRLFSGRKLIGRKLFGRKLGGWRVKNSAKSNKPRSKSVVHSPK
jgi:hypothetical protein